jgi:hypothetical protein
VSLANFPKLSELESQLIVGFVEFADLHGLTRVDSANLHTDPKAFGIRPLMLKPTFEKLCEKGVLNLTRDNDTYYYELSSNYSDEIDEYVSFILEKPEQSAQQSIPAADRFVSVSDNQIDTSQATVALNELSEAIRSSNGLVVNPDDKAQISREISFIKEIIEQPRIHVAALWDSVKHNSTLAWLAKDAVSGVVRAAASKAFDTLVALLNQIWPHH